MQNSELSLINQIKTICPLSGPTATIWDLVINENNSLQEKKLYFQSITCSIILLLFLPLLPNLKFTIEGNQKPLQSMCDLKTYPSALGKQAALELKILHILMIFHNCPDNTQHTWQTKSYYQLTLFTLRGIDPNVCRSEYMCHFSKALDGPK